MKAEVLDDKKGANRELLRVTVATLCSAFLFIAYFVKANTVIQSLLYVFAVINVGNNVADGFKSICNIKPNANSMLFLSVLFSALHSTLTLGGENYFCFSAFLCFCFKLGDVTLKEKTYVDGICAKIIVALCAVFVLSITLNLAFGEGMYESMRRTFLACVVFCPASIIIADVLASFFCMKYFADCKIFAKSADVLARLGKVRDVICDSRGVVTEIEYSLHDIYCADGDKGKILSVAASIEQHFNHDFSNALKKAVQKSEESVVIAEKCYKISGKGVGGTVDGEKYFIGNKKLLREKKVELPNAIMSIDFGESTPLYVIKNGEFYGVLIFKKRKKSDADFVINEMKRLGKRCTLIAANKYENSKCNFDILIREREKVLQEFKNGARIKAMVISQKNIANADVVATLVKTGTSDIVISGLTAAFHSLVIGKFFVCVMRICTFFSVVFAAIMALTASLGLFISPIVAAVVSVLPIGFVFLRLRVTLPEIATSEDDDMFGKINYTMHINGMNCAHCSARVKTALESLKGVSAQISLEEKTARVKCSAKTTAEELEKAVTESGFTVVSIERV